MQLFGGHTMLFLGFLDFIKYLLLGLVQGITEPLPVSSSGHLVIFKNIFNVTMVDETNFNIFVNFGSLIAIVVFYRHFLKDILSGAWQYVFKKNQERKKDFWYCMYVVIATIPAGIAGLLIKDLIENKLSTLLSVGIALFITGSLLLFIQWASKKATKENIGLRTSIFMGIAQIAGLIPGISRSGATASLGVIDKVKLERALRFSFMMYIPISIASLALGIYELDTANTYILGYTIAFIMSFIGTFFAIRFFFKLVKKDNLKYFGYYCLVVAISVLIYVVVTQ